MPESTLSLHISEEGAGTYRVVHGLSDGGELQLDVKGRQGVGTLAGQPACGIPPLRGAIEAVGHTGEDYIRIIARRCVTSLEETALISIAWA